MLAEVAAEYVYVDTALGALNRRNHVRRLSEVDFRDNGAERYISHRRGPAALLEWVHSHHNASGNPTIEGFDGEVWDTSLPFDFDDRHDPAHALDWLRQFLDRLAREDVPLEALRIYFSGAKGFHLEIPHTLFGGFEPSTELHVYEKAAALDLMQGIPFDTAVYDKLRLWRLPNTLNAKGQHYKVQLSIAEVNSLSMQEILELANAPRPRLVTAPDEEWSANDYLAEVWRRACFVDSPVFSIVQKQETGQLPASDERRDRAISIATVGLIASHWPTDASLSRHSDYLLPLSGFLAQRMGAEQVAALLKEAALQAGDASFLEDRTRHWQDEIDRLALNSVSKIANNQPVEGLPTIANHWPELADLLSTLFVVRIRPSKKSSTNGAVSGFTFTSIRDMLAEPPENTPFICDGMLPAAGLSLWGAKPKVGKSVGVRNLAVSVARGEPFLDRSCQQGPVLILALEEKRPEVTNHFRDMGCDEELIHIHTGAAPQTSKEGIAALATAIAVYQPSLVVVDPVFKLVRVHDSSDYAELTRELEPVIELARNTGCHIAVTHHLGKMVRDGGDDVLGSTAIFGAVDTLVIMRRVKDDVRVMHTVQRYGKDMTETTVPMDEFTGRISLGSAISEIKMSEAREAVIELLKGADGVDQETVRHETGVASQAAYRALMALLKEELVTRSGRGRPGDPYRYRLASDTPESSCFPVFPIKGEKTGKQGKSSPIEPVGAAACRACGKPLSEAEAGSGWGLHFGCSLPFEGDSA
jgi:hypothetical protein